MNKSKRKLKSKRKIKSKKFGGANKILEEYKNFFGDDKLPIDDKMTKIFSEKFKSFLNKLFIKIYGNMSIKTTYNGFRMQIIEDINKLLNEKIKNATVDKVDIEGIKNLSAKHYKEVQS